MQILKGVSILLAFLICYGDALRSKVQFYLYWVIERYLKSYFDAEVMQPD
jgi:hypothetical protein